MINGAYKQEAPELTPKMIQKFQDRIEKRGPDECWLWIGDTIKKGYGRLTIYNGKSRNLLAHRVVHFIATGEWPINVIHSCDNPPCCNPKHLSGGTMVDNMADMKSKGRAYYPGPTNPVRGEEHHNSKLTPTCVTAIRRLHAIGVYASHLSRAFGVTEQNIAAILTRKSWAHVE
jgi:hypothetical protein